jgi:multidrug resistance efflux pump
VPRLPRENATGQFVKVVQRLPVRIDVTDGPDVGHPLYPGLFVSLVSPHRFDQLKSWSAKSRR